MSGDDWSPGQPGYVDPEHAPSARTVPIYVLFLIMLGSGIFTLVVLWVCVQYLYYRRRVRRARADVERTEQPAWEFAPHDSSAPGVKDVPESDAKKCDSAGAEMTYVVMAGEDKPTFLALPSSNPNRIDDAPTAQNP